MVDLEKTNQDDSTAELSASGATSDGKTPESSSPIKMVQFKSFSKIPIAGGRSGY